LTRREDAELALGLGADALGFVFDPNSPRYVGDNLDILRFVASSAPYTFCVAVYTSVTTLHSGFQAVQFEQEGDAIGAPGVMPAGILTLRFGPETSAHDAVEAAKVHLRNRKTFPIRGILIEAHHPEMGGGTGITMDWDFAAEFNAKCPALVTLAGGLTPDNVTEAIRKVRPYSVDVCSGIEDSPGVKSESKMRDFIQAVQDASSPARV
jgi:phosphoribosylanthranilate isomerase